VSSPAFISYSREDSEFAFRLAQDLRAAGANVWLDQLDISPGRPWDNAIEDALMGAPQMLIILSPSSAKSDNVRNEISFALDQGKIIVPVLYKDCVVPLRLQRSQRIDFRADYAAGLAHLLANLRVNEPDPAVLQRAAEGDAQRQAAWQAREVEAQRLRDLTAAQEREDATRIPAAQEQHHPQSVYTPSPTQASPVTTLPKLAWQQIRLHANRVLSGIVLLVLAVLLVSYWRGHLGGNSAQNATTTADAAALYQQAEGDDDRSDWTDAMPLLVQACSMDYAESCMTLGYRYDTGTGVMVDEKKAVELYEEACNGNSSNGCDHLGDHYLSGQGVDRNTDKAKEAYQKGCNLGLSAACDSLRSNFQ
jgi:TPR repeat protein